MLLYFNLLNDKYINFFLSTDFTKKWHVFQYASSCMQFCITAHRSNIRIQQQWIWHHINFSHFIVSTGPESNILKFCVSLGVWLHWMRLFYFHLQLPSNPHALLTLSLQIFGLLLMYLYPEVTANPFLKVSVSLFQLFFDPKPSSFVLCYWQWAE